MSHKVDAAFASFLQMLIEDDTSPKTHEAYLGDLNGFKKWVESNSDTFEPSEIITLDIVQYRNWLQEEGRAPATINRKLVAIKRYCQHLVDIDVLSKDPSKKVKLVPEVESAPRHMSGKQEHKLVKAVMTHGTIRDQALIILMLNTGLRAMEVCQLERRDIELSKKAGRVMVRGGKRNKYRKVPLNSTAREIMREYIDQLPLESKYLWPGINDGHLGTRGLGYVVKKYVELAGLKNITPHVLRHRFAYKIVKASDLNQAATFLGHDSLDTTAVYTVPTDEDLENTIQKIATD
jgi:integrase/recombinase XerD